MTMKVTCTTGVYTFIKPAVSSVLWIYSNTTWYLFDIITSSWLEMQSMSPCFTSLYQFASRCIAFPFANLIQQSLRLDSNFHD